MEWTYCALVCFLFWWWKFETIPFSHTDIARCGPRGPSVWSEGPWPLLFDPFKKQSLLLHLLLEDCPLFILLASFLFFSFSLSLQSFVSLLEAGTKRGFNAFTAEGTSAALVFALNVFRLHWQCVSIFAYWVSVDCLRAELCTFIKNEKFWQLLHL